jgi:hypothetical protein
MAPPFLGGGQQIECHDPQIGLSHYSILRIPDYRSARHRAADAIIELPCSGIVARNHLNEVPGKMFPLLLSARRRKG